MTKVMENSYFDSEGRFAEIDKYFALLNSAINFNENSRIGVSVHIDQPMLVIIAREMVNVLQKILNHFNLTIKFFLPSYHYPSLNRSRLSPYFLQSKNEIRPPSSDVILPRIVIVMIHLNVQSRDLSRILYRISEMNFPISQIPESASVNNLHLQSVLANQTICIRLAI